MEIRPGNLKGSSATPSVAPAQTARRLLARVGVNGTDPEPAAAMLQQTCTAVFNHLRDAMGEFGADALLGRALARAEVEHPALKHLRRDNVVGIHRDGIVASIDAHGIEAVQAAVEALLTALVEVLARLIGEDMAIRIVDPEGYQAHRRDGSEAS